MIILTVDEIIMWHSKLIAATGGSSGLRDKGLLESAVFSCCQTFGGEELYPDLDVSNLADMLTNAMSAAYWRGNVGVRK